MLLRPALLVLGLAASSLAWGDAPDVPARVARLSYVEGGFRFQAATEPASSALPDRPLERGDRLTTERDGRAELAFGNAVVRLDERSELSLADLDETAVRVRLDAGTASVHLRELLEGETFEVATPNTTIALQEPGEYRVDVADDGATEFTVRTGAAEIATAGGPVRVADRQRVRLEGGEARASLAAALPADAFDEWVLDREVQLAQAEPPPGEPAEDYENEALDRYGDWYDEPSYGRVWMPSYAYGGWDPFRYGYWQRVGFGWTWFDPMPWSAFTFNYGRWAYLNHLNRWCWVPERRRHHERQVAQDTRPFGHPRGDRRDPRPDDRARRDDDERRRVASSSGLPRRINADRRPVLQLDRESAKSARSGTMVPGSNRETSAPQRSAPAAQSGGSTMRPSRPTQSSSQTPSRSAAAPSNRGFATFQTP